MASGDGQQVEFPGEHQSRTERLGRVILASIDGDRRLGESVAY